MTELVLIMAVGAGLLAVPVLLMHGRVSEEVAFVGLVSLGLSAAAIVLSAQGGLEIRSGSAATFQINGAQALIAARILATAGGLLLASGMIWYALPLRRPSDADADSFLARLRESSLEGVFGLSLVRVVAVALLAFAVSIVLLIGGDALRRETYLFLEPGSLAGLMGSVSFPTGIVAAILFVSSRDRLTRSITGGSLVLLLLFELSKSSRSAAVLLVAVGVFYAALGRSRLLPRLLGGLALAACGVLVLMVVLQTRESHLGHGLLPYAQMLLDGRLSFDAQMRQTTASNLLATVSTTYYSSLKTVPDGFLAVSLDPRSGTEVGWYYMVPELFLSWQVPTNTYGQLASLPLSGTLIGWFAVAGLLSVPGIVRSHASVHTAFVLRLGSLTLTVLMTVMFMQYTLRGSIRWAWLAIVATVLVTAVDQLLQRQRTRLAPAVPQLPERPSAPAMTGPTSGTRR